ncbi:histidine kinase dimerization/phospho-acceptor domain-containing protein [Paenibacillus macerans]|uniref:histidine kinase dimerization/phospho-acceptor domain-containing protein n=1 Tax=Paenibacillus macerans TaxID=44252 RepID=UPI003D314490
MHRLDGAITCVSPSVKEFLGYTEREIRATKTQDLHLLCDIGFLSLTRDISHRKRDEQRVIEDDKLNVVGQLAAGIAHEIRNPLTTLKGFLQILEREKNPKKEYIHIMKEEIRRIEIITSEMLYLGKPAHDHKEACNILDIVKDVIALLLPETNLRDIPIRFANLLESDNLRIFCNTVQIKQVLINTIKNAMDASRKNDVIEVELSSERQKTAIRIIDQGSGIHPDNIVKEHNGIHVDSKLNEGTTFTLKFPVFR